MPSIVEIHTSGPCGHRFAIQCAKADEVEVRRMLEIAQNGVWSSGSPVPYYILHRREIEIPEPESSCVVSDGCGSEWVKCNRPDCDLQVVRPGKVQCSCED